MPRALNMISGPSRTGDIEQTIVLPRARTVPRSPPAAGVGRPVPQAVGHDAQPNWDYAAADDVAIPYLQRIREYYQALGYGAPYEWAHYAAVPFHRLNRLLSECRIALITTAAPYQPGKGDQGPGAPYNAKAKFYTVYSGDAAKDHDLRISHVAIDRKHTLAEDHAAYFPLTALRHSAAEGRIDSVAPRFHGAPTNRSHRMTLEVDGPEIVARCMADDVDAAILVPNCPVCHQTVSLIARILEERRHFHGRHGVRERYRRICGRTSLVVLRFPAR